MSKESRSKIPGRPFRPALAALAILALAVAAFAQTPAAADAAIFAVSIVDPDDPGFDNNDFDLSDAQIFVLTQSDGVIGNSGFSLDTYFAETGSSVWIGISAANNDGPLNIDADDYGRFRTALCNDNNGDGDDFEIPQDNCAEVEGLNSDNMHIPDDGNSFDHVPLAGLPRMGIAVEFECEDDPGIARIVMNQGNFIFQFFIVCHGPLDSGSLSSSATTLEIYPQFGSTAHALLRLDLRDESGFIVAGYEVDWRTDRCSIETIDVSGFTVASLDSLLLILRGNVALAETTGPDANFDEDASRTIVLDFNDDGELESAAFAILHCDPAHSPTRDPGPINITAHVSKEGHPSREFSIKLTLVGPPAHIFLNAAPTTVRCGEKVTVDAVVVDAIGQNVSDFTKVSMVTNLGGTTTAGALLAAVAPISSNNGITLKGVVTFFVLTSEVHVGQYQIILTTRGHESLPPISEMVTVNCFKPATPTPAAAPTVVAPSLGTGIAAGATIRPPSTGDGGLR